MDRIQILLSLLLLSAGLAASAELVVDFGRPLGSLRPLHGVNLGPLCHRGTLDLTDYHRQIAPPLTRLHDVVWYNAEAVDVHTLFRSPDADPANPASYDFRATDDYLQAIVDAGSGIVYRLGESIEHTPRKYFVHPPADPEKWAQVCLGIIRHYNDGWAGGFRHGIRYWEIWNEPDIGPAMWSGTEEQYLRLYEVTAKAIKARFPEVMVGGPALGHVGDLEGDTLKPTPFAARFLAFCRDRRLPLDFFSWHRYTADPWDLPRRARAVRKLLDDHGFVKTESHLNEWNYLPGNDWRPMLKDGQGAPRREWYAEMGGPRGAAFAAAALLLLQDASLDVGCYYTGDASGFGLFDTYGEPKKTFHAFRAFRELLDAPERVSVEGAEPGRVAACAGLSRDHARGAVLVSLWEDGPSPPSITLRGLPWSGATRVETYVLDGSRDLESLGARTLSGQTLSVQVPQKAPAVLLLKLGSLNPREAGG